MKLNEPTKQSPKPSEPAAWKWDADKVSSKLKEVLDYYKTFDGRPGYNPWFFVLRTFKPLEARVGQGEASKELWDAIMGLEKKEPTV